MTFTLDEQQIAKLRAWKAAKSEAYTGAIGGRYEYRFFPTSIGTVVKVHDCLDDDEIDLTDYESF